MRSEMYSSTGINDYMEDFGETIRREKASPVAKESFLLLRAKS